MCIDCAMTMIGDAIPVKITSQVRATAEMIGEWYEQDGHGVGGILHVILDDDNLEDGSLDITGYVDLSGVSHQEAYEAGLIIGMLRNLTLPERAVAIALVFPRLYPLPEGTTVE